MFGRGIALAAMAASSLSSLHSAGFPIDFTVNDHPAPAPYYGGGGRSHWKGSVGRDIERGRRAAKAARKARRITRLHLKH